MKRMKKSYILIKRIFFSKGTYDYIWKERKEGEEIIESTRERNNRDFQFLRAEKRVELWFRTKKLFENKNIQKIIWLLVGMLISILGRFLLQLFDINKN